MRERSELPPTARDLLRLADHDAREARSAMARLSVDEQVAAVCEAPLERRAKVLDLVPVPEEVIPRLPEAELCFTCKHLGVSDASWILALATDDQIQACIDLDTWLGLRPVPQRLDAWIASLAEAGDATLLRAARKLDAETLALYLRHHVHVSLKPAGDEDWQPPEGGQTLEGQFYFTAIHEGDDIAPLIRMLHVLFQGDYWLYFRMMQSVDEELQTELEEWSLRWRTGRLEDLGFPTWEESMRIYGHLRKDRLAEVPAQPIETSVQRWSLPIWITNLPASAEAGHSLFRTAAGLEPEARGDFFWAFIRLANQVAVADRMDLGDAEALPRAIEKAAAVASRGLEHIAKENGLRLEEALARLPLERLFRVGVNLAPDGVRPSLDDDEPQNADTDAEDPS